MSVDPYQLAIAGPFATVFDVGAHDGKFAIACLNEWPDCDVYSFEPLRGIASAMPDRWHWIRVALGETRGTVEMNRNEFLPSSSILEMTDLHRWAFPYTAKSEQVEVTIDTLLPYLDGFAKPGTLLKVDVQGYELEVLKGAGQSLQLVDVILVEANHAELYAGAAPAKAISDYLTIHGFQHVATLDVLRHPETGQLLQTDELWRHR